MRSEERYGIIYIVLLLLWGTLITEPLRVFTGFFYDALLSLEATINVSSSGKSGALIIVGITLCVTMLLLNAAKTELYKFMPCILITATTLILLMRSVESGTINVSHFVATVIMLVIVGLTHVFKLENVLLWLCDLFVSSLSVFLTVSLIVKPLAEINAATSRIFFAANGSDINLAVAFDGLFTLPAVVWGIFFGIIVLLPQVYTVFLGRQG